MPDDSPTRTNPQPTDWAVSPHQTSVQEDAGGGPAALPTGTRYALGAEIARGGMGAVFAAHDTLLDRDVAVKVLQDRYPAGSSVAARFVEEARITGQLQHPGVPPVHDLGTLPDGRPFLAMKLVRGQTLADQLAARPDPAADLSRFVQAFEQVCQTVAFAHAQGIIHRDLKPHNVMVGAFGEVQVMDWGLAKHLADAEPAPPADDAGGAWAVDTAPGSDTRTRAGSVLGTPAYMPPEQARGDVDRIDRRADVFSLGAVLCEILTGRPPYAVGSAAAAQAWAAAAQLDAARAALAGCGADPDLIALAGRCLAADPAARPADAGEVAAAVAAHRAGVADRLRAAEVARAADLARAAERRKRRRVQALFAVTAVAIVAGVAVAAEAVSRDRAARAADTTRAVEVALARADDLRGRAAALPTGTPAEADAAAAAWREAAAAADQASAAADAGRADPGLREKVADAVGAARASAAAAADVAAAARRQARFRADLDAARLDGAVWVGGENAPTGPRYSGGYDTAATARGFAAAFRTAGADPADAASLAAFVRGLPDPDARADAVLALDEWAAKAPRDPAARARLAAAADAVDADPWRVALRRAVRDRDAAAVARSADDAIARRLPPGAYAVLADAAPTAAVRGRVLAHAVALYPGDFWFNNRMAAVHGSARRYDQAVGYYRAALALRPDAAMAHNNLGVALRETNDPDAAIACHRRAIELDPTLVKAHNALGMALRLKKDYAAAAASHRRAIALDPGYASARTNLGHTLLAAGDRAGAVACYRRVVEIDPANATAWADLGYVLDEVWDAAGAVACYRKAVELNPKYATAWNNLGVTVKNLGDVAAAEAYYRTAIAATPTFGLPHNNLGDLLRGRGDLAGALAEYKKAVELSPRTERYERDVRQAEQDIATAARVPAVAAGRDVPATPADAVAVAEVALLPTPGHYALAVRLYEGAFAKDPKLAAGYTYNAACGAVLAAAGRGVDPPPAADRSALRGKGLAWLRADLAAARRQAASSPAVVHRHLRNWVADADLAVVRHPMAVGLLPAAERPAWRALWADARAILARTAPREPAPLPRPGQ